ncbi:MAG: hypothetical protein AAGC67_14080 [Myxococcota bacterium]
MSATVRRICLVLIGVLYVVSVPWYREGGQAPAIWLGLPDWVAVSVLCYGAVAVLNAIAWSATEVHDDVEGPDGEETPR